eukprot:SM000125S26103  [mRNA]  locus=s125:412120:412797:+ [translate_table: standard]
MCKVAPVQVERLVRDDARIDQYPRLVKGQSRTVWEWQTEGALLSPLQRSRRRALNGAVTTVQHAPLRLDNVRTLTRSALTFEPSPDSYIVDKSPSCTQSLFKTMHTCRSDTHSLASLSSCRGTVKNIIGSRVGHRKYVQGTTHCLPTKLE